MAPYLISRAADPLFALFIGASAASIRIRREEAEAGRGGTVLETLRRRAGYYFGM
ncbi:hypothetical protein BZA05DRAFT_444755 [Tricharina praecox]|uniref:uncharacterized protein n=1 Tax=Tricharina praecox TaxID=43433 RepID=UPI002220E204|nr:uncharacterized protein BZA05DRAFT_444755 [Tricharina praecox]KAI5852212.1 hypothetical protein BZA05DRAFT_444755 [Tricharina praecox]